MEVKHPDAQVLNDGLRPSAVGVFVFPLLASKYGKGKVGQIDEKG